MAILTLNYPLELIDPDTQLCTEVLVPMTALVTPPRKPSFGYNWQGGRRGPDPDEGHDWDVEFLSASHPGMTKFDWENATALFIEKYERILEDNCHDD